MVMPWGQWATTRKSASRNQRGEHVLDGQDVALDRGQLLAHRDTLLALAAQRRKLVRAIQRMRNVERASAWARWARREGLWRRRWLSEWLGIEQTRAKTTRLLSKCIFRRRSSLVLAF